MRILMIHPHDIFSLMEPWTTRIRNFAVELHKRGHEIRLAYFYRASPHKIGTLSEDVPIELLEMPRGFVYTRTNYSRLRHWIQWAEVVHLQKCLPYAVLPVFWALHNNPRPFHYDWDDWEVAIHRVEHGKSPGYSLRTMEDRLPEFADTISVSSDQIRRLCLDKGIQENRIFDAPVGADIQRFRPNLDESRSIRDRVSPHGAPVVIYMGQLHATQYVDVFLKAVAAIRERWQDTVFLVVGDGTHRKRLQKLSVDLGLQDCVVFTGAVEHTRIPAYLAAADIGIVYLEDNEATRAKSPLKVAEYMAAGLPMVASRVGDIPKMVGDAGILVDSGSREQLAAGMETLLNDEALRKRFAGLARQRAETIYNWRSISANLEAAYIKAVEQ